jgi:hypothetical protein
MFRTLGVPVPSLRFRLRLLGWFASGVVWCCSLIAIAGCLLASIALLVWSWSLWPSQLYAVLISMVLAMALCTISLLVLALVVFVLDACCSSGSLRVRYAAAYLARLDATLPSSPTAALVWLVPAALPVLHELLLEQGRLLREDDLASTSQLRRLALAEERLARLTSRLDSVFTSPLAAPAAAEFFSAHRARYAAPSVQYPESFDSFPAQSCALEAPEVFFVLNGRHLVETRPLPSLDPAQTALRIWLHAARPLTKYASVRCMVAPGWLHALLTAEHERFSTPRAPLLSSVSDARVLAHAEATVDIFVGLWSPPSGFDRALAAAETLARLPSARATARPVG